MDDSFQSGLNLFNEGYEMENEDTKISVTLGYTLNLGNFQSLRLDLGVVDSRRNGENPDQAFERVYKFVEDKLTEKINEAKSEINE
jgi:hypothetical protein